MSLTPVSVRPTSGPTGLGGSTPAALLSAGVGTLAAKSTNGTATLQTLVWNVGLASWLPVNLIAKVSVNTILPDSTKNGGVDSANFVVPADAYYCAWLTSTPPEGDIANLTVEIDGAAAGSSGVVTVTHAMTPYFVTPSDRYLLVDTSGGVVTVKMLGTPTAASPLQIIDAARSFAVNNLTIDGNGHNVNGAATLVVSTQDDCPLVLFGGTTWEVTPSSLVPVGNGVSVVNFGMSPYTVLASDRTIMADTTGGTITITLPASGGAYVGQPLTIVDQKRQFGTGNIVTIAGNGHNVCGAASFNTASTIDGGITIYWTGTTWESNIAQLFANNLVHAKALDPLAFKLLCAQGHNGAGDITVAQVTAGDYISGAVDITDHASLSTGSSFDDFEGTVQVTGKIHQFNATDLSAKTLVFLVITQGL